MRKSIVISVIILGFLTSGCSDDAEKSDVSAGQDVVTANLPDSSTTEPSAEDSEMTSKEEPPPRAEAERPDAIEDYIGLDIDLARQDLSQYGVRINDDAVRISTSEDPGTILAQEPSGGSPFPTTVRFEVAAEPSAVPDVVGMTFGEAEQELMGEGFEVKLVEEIEEGSQDGTVLAQEPQPGSENAAVVSVTVARAPVVFEFDDIEYLGCDCSVDFDTGGSHKANGKLYSSAGFVSMYGNPAPLEFNLSREFRQVSGEFAVADDADSDGSVRVEIIGDGRTLADEFVSFGETGDVEANVTDVLRLEVRVTPSLDQMDVVLGDWRFLALEGEVQEVEEDDE